MNSRRTFIQKMAAVAAGVFGLSKAAKAQHTSARVTIAYQKPDGSVRVLDEFDTTDGDPDMTIETRTGP